MGDNSKEIIDKETVKVTKDFNNAVTKCALKKIYSGWV
jgi:hypothetical protein